VVRGRNAVFVTQKKFEQGVVDQVEGQGGDVQGLVAKPRRDFVFSRCIVEIERRAGQV